MRKVSITALIFCLVLGTGVAAMAKGTTHTASGTVTAVNTADNSLSVKEKAGEETFQVGTGAKLEEHGKTIALADLKSGEKVTIWYTTNAGKNEASRVIVHSMKENPVKSSGRR
ncbi:MAG TPA: hypothetical protein VGX68_22245 [Thermoanaerobaculia bacterium]|jgi:hypothetical protein|nr:hypothetical protein [Thermoanaerobaculia bacterium]